MAECLVTRLRAVINDGNLPILGAVTLTVYTSDGTITVGAEEPNIMEVELLNTTFADGTTKKTISSTSEMLNVSMQTGDVSMIIYNKSSLRTLLNLKNVEGGMTELSGTKLQEMNFSRDVAIDFSTAAGGSFPYVKSVIAFGGSSAQGDVSELIKALNPDQLTLFLFLQNATNLQAFDISLFGAFTKLTELNVSDAKTNGTVESLVAAQRANGRTTCDGIKVGYRLGTGVTYNGAAVPPGDYSDKYLSWTATTITLGDVTINA